MKAEEEFYIEWVGDMEEDLEDYTSKEKEVVIIMGRMLHAHAKRTINDLLDEYDDKKIDAMLDKTTPPDTQEKVVANIAYKEGMMTMMTILKQRNK